MNKKKTLRRSLGCFAAACVCFGCASSPPAPVLYTLQSQAKASATEPLELQGTLGVGPVELPESFRGEAIAVIGKDQQVVRSQTHRWAGDIKKNISRTLAADLSQQLGYDDVWPYPWDTRHRPDKQISLYIEEISGELGQPVHMVAKWTLLDESGDRVVNIGRERFSAETPNDSYASYVTALNQLVSELSERLAIAVRDQWSEQ